MSELQKYISSMLADGVFKITVSNPASKSTEFKRLVVEYKNHIYQISKYTERQVFHDNVQPQDLPNHLASMIEGVYRQLNGWSADAEHMLLISKKGQCTYKKKALKATLAPTDTHNRQKQYLLEEGSIIPPLVDMGIFTREGKVISSMYHKYKQINRFLEIIDDEISQSKLTDINVIDFGCGKSYLTFVLYYYLTQIRGISVNMIGLDLKSDVIEKCNLAAERYGYTGLRFMLGDINGFSAPFDTDMVITLHACDTATDYALFNAVNWNAKYIFSVPCCQHELNSQITPRQLSILSRYGIIKERFSALSTDTIRANLLEYCGYKTQILEFIDLDHTPKNLLIRAVKRATTSDKHKRMMLGEVDSLMQQFGFQPTLYKLLFKEEQQ